MASLSSLRPTPSDIAVRANELFRHAKAAARRARIYLKAAADGRPRKQPAADKAPLHTVWLGETRSENMALAASALGSALHLLAKSREALAGGFQGLTGYEVEAHLEAAGRAALDRAMATAAYELRRHREGMVVSDMPALNIDGNVLALAASEAEGDRKKAVKLIGELMRERTGRPWAVKASRDGYVTITAPNRRLVAGRVTQADREIMAALFSRGEGISAASYTVVPRHGIRTWFVYRIAGRPFPYTLERESAEALRNG